MNSDYIPINCSFHDQLLELATFKRNIELTFVGDDGESVSLNTRIVDVFTAKSKEEFLETSAGSRVRLDRIVKAGHYWNPDSSAC